MRALFQGLIGAAAALALSACVVTGPSGGGKGPNPVTGDAIEVTALDPVPDPAKPGDRKEATAPTEKTRGAASAPVAEAAVAPEVVAARPAAAGDPRPKPRPQGLTVAADPAADTPPAPEAAEAKPEAQKSAAQQACERKGDVWAKAGKAGVFACVSHTRDGGKRCTAGTQCEGDCLARSGTCAPFTPLFGCNEILQDDGTRTTLCRD
ncbi:MAG: hypothetical protein KBF78_03555 [Fuscovulum sp.]|jgi:hypothetical protein|nr:hypothetical protein [Fuscovulum sp.]